MTDRPVRARRPSKATTKTAGGRSAPAKRATKAATKKATATKATATKASATKAVTKKARPTKTSATKTSGTKATPTKTSALKATVREGRPDGRARRSAKTSALKGGETDPRSAKLSPTPREVSVGTDAAFASGGGQPRRRLKNISEVRHFFRTNDVPILFFGATPFNLLGLDRWVRNFTYITYYDAWDGAHPRVFTPSHKPYHEFESGEEINNWLLTNAEVRAHIDAATPGACDPRSRWCSSTARPRISARSWATT